MYRILRRVDSIFMQNLIFFSIPEEAKLLDLLTTGRRSVRILEEEGHLRGELVPVWPQLEVLCHVLVPELFHSTHKVHTKC